MMIKWLDLIVPECSVEMYKIMDKQKYAQKYFQLA